MAHLRHHRMCLVADSAAGFRPPRGSFPLVSLQVSVYVPLVEGSTAIVTRRSQFFSSSKTESKLGLLLGAVNFRVSR